MTDLVSFSMLDVSNAHLTSKTRALLEQKNVEGVLFYDKGPWGWFVHIPEKSEEFSLSEDVPDDLRQCIEYAQDRAFHWIMFDCDGTAIPDLPLYEEIGIGEPQMTTESRILADAYARHLTQKLGRPVTAEVTPRGKIAVKEQRDGGLYGEVSPSFAQAMVAEPAIQHD